MLPACNLAAAVAHDVASNIKQPPYLQILLMLYSKHIKYRVCCTAGAQQGSFPGEAWNAQ